MFFVLIEMSYERSGSYGTKIQSGSNEETEKKERKKEEGNQRRNREKERRKVINDSQARAAPPPHAEPLQKSLGECTGFQPESNRSPKAASRETPSPIITQVPVGFWRGLPGCVGDAAVGELRRKPFHQSSMGKGIGDGAKAIGVIAAALDSPNSISCLTNNRSMQSYWWCSVVFFNWICSVFKPRIFLDRF